MQETKRDVDGVNTDELPLHHVLEDEEESYRGSNNSYDDDENRYDYHHDELEDIHKDTEKNDENSSKPLHHGLDDDYLTNNHYDDHAYGYYHDDNDDIIRRQQSNYYQTRHHHSYSPHSDLFPIPCPHHHHHPFYLTHPPPQPPTIEIPTTPPPPLYPTSDPDPDADTKIAAPDSKYSTYTLLVDRTQDDRAVEISLTNTSRPHMRAFHYAWLSFFVAFFNWFAIAPLLSEVAATLHLTKEQVWTSSICGVAGTAVVRAAIGPFCDKHGARVCIVVTLVVSAVPALALGFVRDVGGLCVMRLFVGVGGATFVTGQYWTVSMFTKEVAGTANALVAGWGNLGGGVTHIVMGSILFPLFKYFFRGYGDEEGKVEELAWRTVMIVPGVLTLATAFVVFRYSDDCPKGNYHKRRRMGHLPEVSALDAMKRALSNINTWFLLLQYACCFGVEITMSNAAALYFKHEFGLSTEKAAAIASVFGWMNLFARGFGGFVSDISNASKGMQGRLLWHFSTLLLEGVTVIFFAQSRTLPGAICAMCIFSVFVQAAEGSTYGIVPYVEPKIMGSVTGLVGAGGTMGGVIFSCLFRQYDYRKAYHMMGYTIIASSFLTAFIFIKGHKGCLCGNDASEVRNRSRMNQLRDQHQQVASHIQGSQEEISSLGDDDLQNDSLRDMEIEVRKRIHSQEEDNFQDLETPDSIDVGVTPPNNSQEEDRPEHTQEEILPSQETANEDVEMTQEHIQEEILQDQGGTANTNVEVTSKHIHEEILQDQEGTANTNVKVTSKHIHEEILQDREISGSFVSSTSSLSSSTESASDSYCPNKEETPQLTDSRDDDVVIDKV